MERPTTIVLAISRQFASGGAFIGQTVAQRLGLRYTDREILAQAARASGLSEADLESREERAAEIWKIAFRQFSLGPPEAPFVAPPLPSLGERDLFALESRIIREIAHRYDAVIVGRGGFHVLADHPGLLSVRVHAPFEWRVRRAIEAYGFTSETAAAEAIRRSDKQRGKFIRTFTGHDWNDACTHHLCLNTGAIGLDLAAELVTTLVASRIKARQSTIAAAGA
jgi:cytidylate kinase